MPTKYLGRDCELSTTGTNDAGTPLPSWNVARAILAQIGEVFRARGGEIWPCDGQSTTGGYGSAQSMDCLRHWPSNGQCYYSDMGHVEACTAPTANPREFAAQCVSTLLAVEEARRLAESRAEDGARYSLSATNADAIDPAVSWGTHLNVSISAGLWEDLCLDHRRPAVLGFVASALAAAIPFFGAGYLLPLNDGATIYSLSGRAHHLSRLKTLSTTEAFRRGLLNTRREPHGDDQERLHLIGFDFAIVAAARLASLVQCIFAAAEEGYGGLNVYEPVRALHIWSFGLDMHSGQLTGKAAMVDGRKLTLPAYMGELAATLGRMCRQGLIAPEAAPGAEEYLAETIELARDAEQGLVSRCARRLDWAAKLMCLLGGPDAWGSAAARLADHDFANTDRRRGVIWRLWDEGLIDMPITRDDAWACLDDGPENTRAWAAGRIIRKFGPSISRVNWDHVELYREADRWWPRLRVELPRLDSLSRREFEPILEQAGDVAQLADLLDAHARGATREADPLMEVADQLAAPEQ